MFRKALITPLVVGAGLLLAAGPVAAQNQVPTILPSTGSAGGAATMPYLGQGGSTSSFLAFTLNPGNPEAGEPPSFQIYPSRNDDFEDNDDSFDDNEIDDLLAGNF